MFGEWLSLVEHLVRDQGVGGSNPLSPTIIFNRLQTNGPDPLVLAQVLWPVESASILDFPRNPGRNRIYKSIYSQTGI
jgi:hypothetical protein